jgi:peptidoglycan/xylan/chitin deacetylase (PgdA/CDA1 family)
MSNTDSQIDIMVTMQDGTIQYYYLATAVASPTAWQKISGQFTMPANAKTATVFQALTSVGYVQIDDVSFGAYQPAQFNRAIISINIDDGWRSAYDNGLPLLNKYSFVSTLYIITETLDYPDYMNTSMIQAFKNQGSEIGSHTVSHPHLATLGAAQLTAELAGSQTVLRQTFGSDVANNFASPYGEYSATVINAIKAYYSSHRSVDSGFNSKDNFDAYNIKVQNVDFSTTLAQIQAWVTQAINDKTWLVLVYHEIGTTTDTTYNTTTANFDAQLSIIKQSGATVETTQQALSEIVPQL